MDLHDLPDDQLQAAAKGEAAAVLQQRREMRRQREQERAVQERERQAKQALRSLPTGDLEEVASDPGRERHPEDGWQLVPSEVWDAGYEKSEVVDLAAQIVEERERAEQERRMQAHQPTARGTVNIGGVQLTTRQLLLLAGAAGAVLLLSSGSSASRATMPVVTESGEIECPECDDTFSKNGMQGHLRWGHDWPGDSIKEFVEGVDDAA
jgi:hypothetical protein